MNLEIALLITLLVALTICTCVILSALGHLQKEIVRAALQEDRNAWYYKKMFDWMTYSSYYKEYMEYVKRIDSSREEVANESSNPDNQNHG